MSEWIYVAQSVVRVGVLGWFSSIVLQSHPAKSTSSASDRLINVWFWKSTNINNTVTQLTKYMVAIKLNSIASLAEKFFYYKKNDIVI